MKQAGLNTRYTRSAALSCCQTECPNQVTNLLSVLIPSGTQTRKAIDSETQIAGTKQLAITANENAFTADTVAVTMRVMARNKSAMATAKSAIIYILAGRKSSVRIRYLMS